MNKQEIQKAINHLTMLGRLDSGEKRSLYDTAITALEHQLTDMWIPCKDRLPTPEEYQRNDCRFIVTDGNRIHEDIYDYMADGYIQPIWIYSKCQPIAWHNMPPRYKETE